MKDARKDTSDTCKCPELCVEESVRKHVSVDHITPTGLGVSRGEITSHLTRSSEET